MSPTALDLQPPVPECWRIIGVTGDRTCPELTRVIHCRNCPVLASAARAFFDRPAPDGYREAWQEILAEPAAQVETDVLTVLIFRLGQEWFALPADVLVEVTPPRPRHRIPHRAAGGLDGVVNIRGQLQTCLSLHALLGIARPPEAVEHAPPLRNPTRRLLVVESQADGADRWVVGVDEVAGMHRLPGSATRPVPATVSQSLARCSATLFDWQDRVVGLLDSRRLFDGLRELVAS